MPFTGRQRPLKLRTDPEPLSVALRDWFRLVRESAEPILKPETQDCEVAGTAVVTAWRVLPPEVSQSLYQAARADWEARTGVCAACGEGVHG